MNWLSEWLRSTRHRDLVLGAALVVVTLAVYLPALNGQFLWDDDAWTTGAVAVLRDLVGLVSIWFSPTSLQQYYPLTGTSFWLDYHLWGWWTVPYHVENVLLHVLGALLFLKLLRKLEVPGAWLAAAVFALHPIMVESVAWITERKNVLSLPLFLGSVMAYLRYSERSSQSSERSQPSTVAPRPAADSELSTLNSQLFYYWLALFLFVGAYLAKASAFCFPAVLLLIFWWKRGCLRWREDVVPTLPFFVLSAGLSMVTVWIEHHHTGAAGKEWAFSFWERCLIAGRALWFYLGNLLWPVNLCFVYPRWHLDVSSLGQWCYPLSAAAVILGLLLARNRIGRGPAAAALFYVGTLFPVLGFINGYGMRYSFVWDHWVYLSSLGLIALGSAVVVKLIERFWPQIKSAEAVTGLGSGPLRLVTSATACALLVALAVLTFDQSKMYKDLETLWRMTLARNPDAFLAHTHLGALLPKERLDEAIAHYTRALEVSPDFPEAHNNLGNALVQKGRFDEAMAHFQKAAELQPDNAATHCNFGGALLAQGRVGEAVAEFQKSLELNPEYPAAAYGLGQALLRAGQLAPAIGCFQKALALHFDSAELRNSLATALFQTGQTDEAIAHLETAVQLRPDYATAYHNLGLAFLQKRQLPEAIAAFQKAVELQPDFAKAHSDLGIALMGSARLDDAAAHFQKAVDLTPGYAEAHFNLAIAQLRKGQQDQALAHIQKALELRPDFPEARRALAAITAEKEKH